MSAQDVQRLREFAGIQSNAADANFLPLSGVDMQSSLMTTDGDETSFSAAGLDDGKECVVLPGGDVQISDTAAKVFTMMAPHHELFVRGGAVVELRNNQNGKPVFELVRAPGLRTRAEKHCRFVAWRAAKDGTKSLEFRVMPTETAEALLQSREAQTLLLQIMGIINCPFVRERDGHMEIVGPGYDKESGLMVTGGQAPEKVPWHEAVSALKKLFEDFRFKTEADRTRAIVMVMTPAFKLGGLIPGHVPIDVAEADESQAGKNYRLKLKAAIYNDHLALVARRQGGVGSMDETFDQYVLNGRTFPVFDNVRGVLDSQHLESFLTADGGFAVRVPHRSAIEIDPSRIFVSMTSNGAETSRDLANRACIVRICKQPAGYRFQVYPEGDLLAHVRANQPYYLGCVFAIVESWIAVGKPRMGSVDHDFQDWARVLGWITTNIFQLAPLLEGHRAAQARVGNTPLTFVRNVALAHHSQPNFGMVQTASDLARLCQEDGIVIPGSSVGFDLETASRQVGALMKRAFGGDAHSCIEVDGFLVERHVTTVARDDGKGPRSQKSYVFRPAGGESTCPCPASSLAPKVPQGI